MDDYGITKFDVHEIGKNPHDWDDWKSCPQLVGEWDGDFLLGLPQ